MFALFADEMFLENPALFLVYITSYVLRGGKTSLSSLNPALANHRPVCFARKTLL